MIDFNIRIPNNAVIHLKEKSHLDYNFYHIEDYGDWLYGRLNTILQIYNECDNCYEYRYGYFEKNYFRDTDEFIPMLYWVTNKDIFEITKR